MRRRYKRTCFAGTKVQILTVLEDINAYRHEAQAQKHLLHCYKSTNTDASCSAPQLSTLEEHLSRTAHARLLPLIESAPTAESEFAPTAESEFAPTAEFTVADDSKERAEMIPKLTKPLPETRAKPLSEALTKPLAEPSEADDSKERAEVIRLLRALDAPARQRAARLAGTPC